MTLGGGGGLGPWRFTTALSADFSFNCDYAFLWLNKSRHTSNSVKICIFVIAVSSTSYLAESVHVATGKQETVKATDNNNQV